MVRQLIAVSLVVAAASACETKTTLSPTDQVNSVRFTAALRAVDEVPPITGVESGASGSVTITFNLTRSSAGVITGGTADFNVTLAGFPAGTAISIAHIHPGFSGNTGGIVVNTGLVAGEVTLGSGSGSFAKNGITMTADVAASVIANPQGFYFNVHSALNPGGVVRGQLVKQ